MVGRRWGAVVGLAPLFKAICVRVATLQICAHLSGWRKIRFQANGNAEPFTFQAAADF